MNSLLRDLSYALRQLRRSRAFTITAILTLALGIGANTAAFTLMHAVLLRNLPVPNPHQLYRIGNSTRACCIATGLLGSEGNFEMFSAQLYHRIGESAPEFEQLAATASEDSQFAVRRGKDASTAESGLYVSGNFFDTLGVTPYQGRFFSAKDDSEKATPVVVLSYAFWKTLGADPNIPGSTISIKMHPFVVAGVAPPGFYGDRVSVQVPAFWLPLSTEVLIEGAAAAGPDPGQHWLYLFGRVRPGTDILALQGRISETLRQFLAALPEHANAKDKANLPRQHVVIVSAAGGIRQFGEAYESGLKTLLLLSAMVLLVASANIANLLLVRGLARRPELSLRIAVGASRGRLTRQMFTESLLLSFLGGLAGLALAWFGSQVILWLTFSNSNDLPIHATPSLPVLAFTFAVTAVVGFVFGVAPARFSSQIQPAEVVRGLSHSTRGFSSRPQKILLVTQSAVSLVLLVGAVLTATSLYKASHQDFGLAPAHRYVIHLDVETADYPPERRQALYDQIQARISALGGVTGVGVAGYSFLEGYNWFDCIRQEGHPPPADFDSCYSGSDSISAHYFSLLDIPVLRGREFTEEDTATSPFVSVVNETFASTFYPGQDPIGKSFSSYEQGKTIRTSRIVGIVKNFKSHGPTGPITAMYFRPVSQRYGGGAGVINSILVRFKSEPEDVDHLLRGALARIDPNLAISDLRSLDSQIDQTLGQQRLIARIAITFAVLALILASVGLYGVTTYIVAQRRTEIGIRMALGSTRAGVIRLVLGEVMLQVGIGLALGLPCAIYTGYLLRTQLYELKWYDPTLLITATIILAVCALTAGFIPARRAASIQPMQALRIE